MDAYMGMVCPFPCTFAVQDWALCWGQGLTIDDHLALYSLVSTYYGGDGLVTFNLPYLPGRTPVGIGTGPKLRRMRLGDMDGRDTHAIDQDNLPAHGHGLKISGTIESSQTDLRVSSQTAFMGNPNGNTLGEASGDNNMYAHFPFDIQPMMGPIKIPPLHVHASGITESTGKGQPFASRDPYLALNYQICIDGLFPSRA